MKKKHKKKKKMVNSEKIFTVEDIQIYINQLFKKYNYPILNPNIEQKNLWGDYISDRLGLDKNYFWKLNSEFLWAAFNTSISIGYAMIARQSCSFPRGIKKVGYDPDDVLDINANAISELHFWYHIHNARECIYRCWERITNILVYICYNSNSEKYYYNTIINKLIDDPKYSMNLKLKRLKDFEKHWTTDAAVRNTLSHGSSSPFIKHKTDIETMDMYDSKNNHLFKIIHNYPDLVQEIESVKNSYMRTFELWSAVKEFIESLNRIDQK